MRILTVAEQPTMAWRNGGGLTRAVAAGPEGAGLDDFHWRVSVADVAAHGPFSPFPGVDRVLALLAGDGVALEGPEGGAVLRSIGDGWCFPGEWPVRARLLGAPTRVLNVMSRRGVARASLSLLQVDGEVALADVAVVIDGALWARGVALAPGDAVLGAGAVTGHGRLARVRVEA